MKILEKKILTVFQVSDVAPGSFVLRNLVAFPIAMDRSYTLLSFRRIMIT